MHTNTMHHYWNLEQRASERRRWGRVTLTEQGLWWDWREEQSCLIVCTVQLAETLSCPKGLDKLHQVPQSFRKCKEYVYPWERKLFCAEIHRLQLKIYTKVIPKSDIIKTIAKTIGSRYLKYINSKMVTSQFNIYTCDKTDIACLTSFKKGVRVRKVQSHDIKLAIN